MSGRRGSDPLHRSSADSERSFRATRQSRHIGRRAMTIAATVQRYLSDCGVAYSIVEHPRTISSSRTAQAGHVPGDRLAKAVVLKSETGYTMAVVPASCHIRLGEIQDYLNRPVGLATEDEVGRLFGDCDLGAIPP